MDISSLGITGVAVITVICFLVGQVVKATGLDNKWIPIICGVFGAVLGILGMFIMPEFPASDYLQPTLLASSQVLRPLVSIRSISS